MKPVLVFYSQQVENPKVTAQLVVVTDGDDTSSRLLSPDALKKLNEDAVKQVQF